MTALIDMARKHVESAVADLTGEADFMPFLTYDGTVRGEPATGYVGLSMPENEMRNDLADVMIAMLMIHQATEATFASVSWMVQMNKDDYEVPGRLMPSEHPDRVEAVFMLHVAPEGDTLHSARISRLDDNSVALGDWEISKQLDNAGGRFGDALHMGIKMAASLPPVMVEFIDANMDTPADLIEPILRAMGRIRKGQ